MNGVKILVWDIETSPIISYLWNLYDQQTGLHQMRSDWSILAWAAKWLGDPESKAIYADTSHQKDINDDKAIVTKLWKLLDEADIVITHNGEKFDIKKFNARAAIHGLPPLSNFKSTDTLKESRKVFKFTSHSLEYMTNVLNKKYKKLKHPKYSGFDLWKEVLKGNQDAWKEMRKYCIHDVLSTEELYTNIQGYIKTQNLSCYFDDADIRCRCGSKNIYKKGFVFTDAGKFQGYKCRDCGSRPHGRVNLFSKEKKANLLKGGK